MSGYRGLEDRLQRARAEGQTEIINAHAHSGRNREELARSEKAGCFFCAATFHPQEIKFWVDGDQCALCPKCGTDSVIGEASGFPVTSKEFLKEMNKFWFC